MASMSITAPSSCIFTLFDVVDRGLGEFDDVKRVVDFLAVDARHTVAGDTGVLSVLSTSSLSLSKRLRRLVR